MRLKELEYAQHVGTDDEWGFKGLTFGDVNLLVGLNATGKTRTLKIIHSLAQLLTGKRQISEAHWIALFVDGKDEYRYELKIFEGVVEKESFVKDGKTLLERDPEGNGTIQAEDPKGRMQFKIPPATPAAIAKRDEYQHAFLEPLHDWAASLRYYPFGSPMGRDKVAVPDTTRTAEFDPSDFELVVGLFLSGIKKYPKAFESKVRQDMQQIGYGLEEVGVEELADVKLSLPVVKPPVGLFAKETDLKGKTTQLNMSQGMFRALSLIGHTVYAELSGAAACVVVDDIGEGLDFERSTQLIHLLRERAKNDTFQLIMATNDRFVMNALPLETWSCMRRTAGGLEVLNYRNSKDLFDNFKLTGLAHFDFLTTQFFSSESAVDA